MLLKHREDGGIIHHNLCVFSIQNDPLQEDSNIMKIEQRARQQNSTCSE